MHYNLFSFNKTLGHKSNNYQKQFFFLICKIVYLHACNFDSSFMDDFFLTLPSEREKKINISIFTWNKIKLFCIGKIGSTSFFFFG